MSALDQLEEQLRSRPRKWLVTGAAGFIGSNLVEALLRLGQWVVGLDNFSTGLRASLDDVSSELSPSDVARFELMECDIRSLDDCVRACTGVQHVLHQAALGSVPRSIALPLETHASNVTGHLNMLVAARDCGVGSFVYASSSSVYGDHPALPKVEDHIGEPLSPYAATKLFDEKYAQVFASSLGFRSIGLRYFNVFGRRQSPDGPYAAVIPRWIRAIARGEAVEVFGDGETSRDFCHVSNAVAANILAATVERDDAWNQVYNVAVGGRTTLNELLDLLGSLITELAPGTPSPRVVRRESRPGDVRHSQASVEKARALLGYEPRVGLEQGLRSCLPWYLEGASARAK